MKFSITIPAFKTRYLSEAILSVVNQTYQEWELVIVDDCSPEDVKAVVNPFLEDNRIHYYRNEKNCGAVDVVDNWNICLSYCTGDYVVCMGDDDRLLPSCLEHYKHLIEHQPGLNVYHTRTEIIDERGHVTDTQEQRPEWESAISLIYNRWASRNKQYIGDFCYSAQYLKSVGGYHKQPLAWGSDDMTAVMAAKEKGIANGQQFGFQYRESAVTISNTAPFAMTKLLTTLNQYLWYADLLAELAKEATSPSDRHYLDTIDAPRRDYFYKSLGKNCTDYIKGNPRRLVWCYRQLKPLHFPLAAFAKWYLSSIYHLFL